jgi:hypothetical protein
MGKQLLNNTPIIHSKEKPCNTQTMLFLNKLQLQISTAEVQIKWWTEASAPEPGGGIFKMKAMY